MPEREGHAGLFYGFLALIEETQYRGTMLAVEEINAAGGIKSRIDDRSKRERNLELLLQQAGEGTDAFTEFNIGCAVGAVQSLPAGVYIAMNGRCFPWDRVRKNREKGVFESA